MRRRLGIVTALTTIAFAVPAARGEESVTLPPAPSAPSAPSEPPAAGCLNDRDLRRLVENGTVVPPIAAIRTARSEVAGDAVGARLCSDGHEYVYRVTVLTKDGRIVRVGVDGRTGRPADRR